MNLGCQNHRYLMATYIYETPPVDWKEHLLQCGECQNKWAEISSTHQQISQLLGDPDEKWEREVVAFFQQNPPKIRQRKSLFYHLAAVGVFLLAISATMAYLFTQIDFSPPQFIPQSLSKPVANNEFHTILSRRSLNWLKNPVNRPFPPQDSPRPSQLTWLTPQGISYLKNGQVKK